MCSWLPNSGVTSNYPVPAVQTAFAAIAGSLSTGTSTVTYAPYATLMSMEEVAAAISVDGFAHTLQTWQIMADGTMPVGGRTAQVQVTATLDTQKISTSGTSLAQLEDVLAKRIFRNHRRPRYAVAATLAT